MLILDSSYVTPGALLSGLDTGHLHFKGFVFTASDYLTNNSCDSK